MVERNENFALFCLAFMLVTGQYFTCEKPLLAASIGEPGHSDTREIHFPEEHSLGPLLVVPIPDRFANRDNKTARIVGAAHGTVKVVIPKNHMLLIQLNRYAMDHPDSLMKVSEHGVDALTVGFVSMDEARSTTDTLLKYVPHFHDLISLNVAGSDATDVGMEVLRQATKLKYINAFGCFGVHGSCLRALASLPNLTSLDFGSCPVDQACFRYLPQMPKLRFLAIDTKKAKREEIKLVGKCQSLTILKFSWCRELNDETISYLSGLKNLHRLDIRRSSVSVKGLKKLSALKLGTIDLPRAYYSQKEMADLRKAFPKTQLLVGQ